MALSQAKLVQPQMLTAANRNLLALGASDAGRMVWNTTSSQLEVWDGSSWRSIAREPVLDGGAF